MALSTYLELQQSMATWLIRSDLVAQIPDFISLFEANVRRDMRVTDMVTEGTPITFLQGVATAPQPDGYLEPLLFTTDRAGYPTLEYVTPQQIIDLPGFYRRGPSQYFTTIGNDLRLGPIPDSDLVVTPTYYAFAALSGDGSSNWLLTKHPDAYLYGSLLHSAPFLNDDARLGTWGGLYTAALDKIILSDVRKRTGGGPLRARSGRQDIGRCA